MKKSILWVGIIILLIGVVYLLSGVSGTMIAGLDLAYWIIIIGVILGIVGLILKKK